MRRCTYPFGMLGKLVVDRIIVCVDDALWKNPLRDDRHDRLDLGIWRDSRNHPAAALYHPEDKRLFIVAATIETLALVQCLFLFCHRNTFHLLSTEEPSTLMSSDIRVRICLNMRHAVL